MFTALHMARGSLARRYPKVLKAKITSVLCLSSYGGYLYVSSYPTDGAVYVATSIDPLFVVLPHLETAANRGFCDAETIVETMGGAALGIPALFEANFAAVCDCKAAGGQSYYLLNQTKVGGQCVYGKRAQSWKWQMLVFVYIATYTVNWGTITQLSIFSLQNKVLEWLDLKVQQTKLGLQKQRQVLFWLFICSVFDELHRDNYRGTRILTRQASTCSMAGPGCRRQLRMLR